uniref:Aa_trans domain-containing protein n=1 Tax=Heterorhabditis bacteriophora TaxID=37862 RepID=A0A1I7XUG9_HETBA
MNISLLINIMCWLSGVGLLLYFGIEDASSFRTFVPHGFSISDSLISLAVGFLVSIYQLTASPLMYQV